jgi:hypothetical protein
MVIAQVQGYSFYWSCNKFVINNEYVMPVRRYEKFDQYIYINKMETDVLIAQPDHDKLHKIRPLVNLSYIHFQRDTNQTKIKQLIEAIVAYR